MNRTQCKMARAALGWSVDDLAQASGVGRRTIARLEVGETVQSETSERLRQAFVGAGIGFTDGGQRAGVTYLRQD